MKAKVSATIGTMAIAVVYTSPALAVEVPNLNVEIYGTLLPFFENVGTFGATQPLNFVSQTDLLGAANHSGIDHERRFRMTSGTSMLGFRGDYAIAGENLKLIWQIESPAPIDGEGPSNWANRNSHAGFTGWWGTLIYGNWDTPMRWVTVTSVNPIKGGYTGDMTPIIGTPGHQLPAWNADQNLNALFQVTRNPVVNPVGFFRHEANSVQYWSPTLAGFSLRAMFAANEHKTVTVNADLGWDPWLLSGYLGWDSDGFGWSKNFKLRLRYAAELHKDFFGTSAVGGPGVPPLTDSPSSTDIGHLGLASVTINSDTDHPTRIVVTGDHLSYHTDAIAGFNVTNEFSRAAVYGLVQQTIGAHNIWGAYGQAFEGDCHITAMQNVTTPCRTTGLGAFYPSAGYMYKFAETTGVYLLGYLVMNDISARYTTFPLLEYQNNTAPGIPATGRVSAGSDTLGVGIGFVHSFSAKLFGDEPKKPDRAAAPEPNRMDAAERDALKAELREELKRELKQELKDELKQELQDTSKPEAEPAPE